MAGVTSTLTLSGSLSIQAPGFPPSAAQTDGTPISETIYTQASDAQPSATLSSDAATAIPFPIGMTTCHFIMIKVLGGSPISLIITSALGASQVIPVDSFICLFMFNQPATAISVQRTAGVATTLSYFIAQHA